MKEIVVRGADGQQREEIGRIDVVGEERNPRHG